MSRCHSITAGGTRCRKICSLTGNESAEELENCICKIHQKVREGSHGDVARDAEVRRASNKRTAPPTEEGKFSCSSKANVNQPGSMEYCKRKGQVRYWGVKRMTTANSPVIVFDGNSSAIVEVGESSTRTKSSSGSDDNIASDDMGHVFPGTGPISPFPLLDNRIHRETSIHPRSANSTNFKIAELSGPDANGEMSNIPDNGNDKRTSLNNSLKQIPRLQFNAEKLIFSVNNTSNDNQTSLNNSLKKVPRLKPHAQGLSFHRGPDLHRNTNNNALNETSKITEAVTGTDNVNTGARGVAQSKDRIDGTKVTLKEVDTITGTLTMSPATFLHLKRGHMPELSNSLQNIHKVNVTIDLGLYNPEVNWGKLQKEFMADIRNRKEANSPILSLAEFQRYERDVLELNFNKVEAFEVPGARPSIKCVGNAKLRKIDDRSHHEKTVFLKISLAYPKPPTNELLNEAQIMAGPINYMYSFRHTPNVPAFMGFIQIPAHEMSGSNVYKKFKNTANLVIQQISKKNAALNVLAMECIGRDEQVSVQNLAIWLQYANRAINNEKKNAMVVDRYVRSFKSIVFQVLYTLENFKRFKLRHNDLHFGNIIITEYNDINKIHYDSNAYSSFFIWEDQGVVHKRLIPLGCRAVIIDFDRSVVVGTNNTYSDNTILENYCDKYGQCNTANFKYDCLMFLCSLKTLLSHPKTKFHPALINIVTELTNRHISSIVLENISNVKNFRSSQHDPMPDMTSHGVDPVVDRWLGDRRCRLTKSRMYEGSKEDLRGEFVINETMQNTNDKLPRMNDTITMLNDPIFASFASAGIDLEGFNLSTFTMVTNKQVNDLYKSELYNYNQIFNKGGNGPKNYSWLTPGKPYVTVDYFKKK